MTYATSSGRQFVVVATGGGDRAALVAFAWDEEKSRRCLSNFARQR